MKRQGNSSEWTIEFKRSAAKELRKLSRKAQVLILDKIETQLLSDPYSGEKLKSKFKGLWRLRAGDYRIIYEIVKNRIVIIVLKISDRKDAYGLPS